MGISGDGVSAGGGQADEALGLDAGFFEIDVGESGADGFGLSLFDERDRAATEACAGEAGAEHAVIGAEFTGDID